MSSNEYRPPLFGPASSSSSSSSGLFPRTFSQNSLAGNLPADSIDLGEIFDDDFFPEDLDFTAFFQDIEAGTPGLAHSRSMNGSLSQKFPPFPASQHLSMRTSSNPMNDMIKVPLPIRMPKIAINNFKAPNVKNGGPKVASDEMKDLKNGYENSNSIGNDVSYDDDNGLHSNEEYRYKINGDDIEDVTVKQKLERRERNREHAKRSRIRKKVLLDSLQDELLLVREENIKLRRIVAERIPFKAHSILETCTALESSLLSSIVEDGEHMQEVPKLRSLLNMETGRASMVGDEIKQHAKILMEPDYRLIHSLVISQQNFVLSDPSLPDNPIVYASEGFCKLSGYKRDEILGRNCRFLQGPGTDQNAVEVIREGVAAGRDISVCLLNYKADGTPFWNQFFVGALRDSDGNVVNFVGVQCEVNIIPVTEIKDRVKKLPIPDF